MKIVIITDGNNSLGMGHVYQSICLANLLLTKGISKNDIYFITKSEDNVIKLISEAGFIVEHHIDDSSIFKTLKKNKPHRIIFDILNVSTELAKKIKLELNIKLIIFTNLTEANQYADITVLADIGSNFKNIYRTIEKTGQIQFFGPKYWLLRPAFYELKKKPKKLNSITKDIMLIFGGADSSNITTAVVNTLMQIDSAFNITVVLGSAFIYNNILQEVINQNLKSKSNIHIVKNIKNVAEVMYANDLVLASPGLSFFEALAVGTPVLGFHQNDLQRDVYKNVFKTFDKTELFKISDIIRNQEFVFPNTPSIQAMEIAEGADEILWEILK